VVYNIKQWPLHSCLEQTLLTRQTTCDESLKTCCAQLLVQIFRFQTSKIPYYQSTDYKHATKNVLNVIFWRDVVRWKNVSIVCFGLNNETHVLFCIVAIGKPERQVRKASHCGSKQQQRSHAMITVSLLVRAAYIWVLLFAYIPFVVTRAFNAALTERL